MTERGPTPSGSFKSTEVRSSKPIELPWQATPRSYSQLRKLLIVGGAIGFITLAAACEHGTKATNPTETKAALTATGQSTETFIPGLANQNQPTCDVLPDVSAVLFYVGAAHGKGPNNNGVRYDDDLNHNGTPDGMEYDRTLGTDGPSKLWQSAPPNGAVSLQDVSVVIKQLDTNCN